MAPNLIFPEGHHYTCGSCTKCCRTEWNVFVDPNAFEKVSGSPLFKKLKAQYGTDPMYRDVVDGNPTCQALNNKNGCVFLAEDNLCMIHRDMGIEAKPLGCREFPFLPTPTPDGVIVGLSYYCSAVQSGSGRPVEEYADVVKGMLKEYRYTAVGLKPIPLTPQISVTWEGYKKIEAAAREYFSLCDLRTAMWRTFMKVCLTALLLSRNLPEAEDSAHVVIDDDRLEEVLEMAYVDSVPRDEMVRGMENMFLLGIIGVLEAKEKPQRRQVTDAIAGREKFHSNILKMDVDLADFDEVRATYDGSFSEKAFRSYAEQMLFRKFLAQKRNIVSNTGMFYMSLTLLEWYRDFSAYARGKKQPDMADVYQAFDVLERDLVMHTRGMDAFFHEMGSAFTRLLEYAPGVFTGSR